MATPAPVARGYTPVPPPPAIQSTGPVEVSTPRWLTVSVALSWALTLVFVLAAVFAVRQHREALNTIAKSSALSVIAAQQISTSLADMDADAANALLNVQQKQQSIDGYHASRRNMTDALVDAAHNITYADEEKQIRDIADQSNEYGARIESAFALHGASASTAVTQYLKAAQLLDKSLLPGAANLDKINRDELDKSYSSIESLSKIQTALVWLTGIALLALLIRMQMFLSERMRRTLNPLCLGATLIAAGLLLYTNHALSSTWHEIQVVKHDAFESIHALWRAKAIAYETNALESRYLLDKTNAQTWELQFKAQAPELAADPAQLVKAPGKMKGLLADELRNITFAGERDAAQEAALYWAKYIEIDGQMRALEQAGQHDKALKLCLGENEGESNWAFKKFSAAVDRTIKINQDQFDIATSRGFDALKGFELVAPIMGLLAALACLFGVLPRIREYSA